MTKIIWANLLPKELDRGGGSTYSSGVRRLLEMEWHGQVHDLHVLPRDPRRRKIKLLTGLLISLVSRQAAKLLYCRSTEAIRCVQSSDADMLVCDHVETAYLMSHFHGRTCLILHNNEGALMQSRGSQGSRLKRWFLSREGNRISAFEEWALRRADIAISLSPDDIAAFHRLVPDKAIRHVPPLFDYVPTPAQPIPHPPRLGFVGNLDWWPNAEALRWYLAEIHPHHTLPLYVAGAGDTTFLAGVDRVHVLGFVPDVRDIWHTFDVMIAPILSGSGVSIKTAEALYNGKPVVATPMGARGLPLSGGSNGIDIRRSATEWIEALRKLAAGARPTLPDDRTRSLFAAPRDVIGPVCQP